MELVHLTEKEYNEFQCQYRYNTFLNSIDTFHLEQSLGFECDLVGLKKDGKIVCACFMIRYPMMKCFHYYYAPRGILIDYENKELLSVFTKKLKKYIRKKRGVQLIIDPYILYQERDADGKVVENGFNHQNVLDNLTSVGWIHQGFSTGYHSNMQTIRWMYAMNLDGYTKDSLWKALHQQTRWSINRTMKYKMQIKELSIDELDVFVDIMNQTGQRRGFETRNLEFYKCQMEAYKERLKCKLAYIDTSLLIQSLEKEKEEIEKEMKEVNEKLLEIPNSKKFNKKRKVLLEAIETNEKRMKEASDLQKNYGDIIPMAASMFIYDRDEVIYLTSGAYEQFRDFYASYAIQWNVICEALSMGYKRYNFYGISGIFDPEDESYGVYAFKKGFPGQVEEWIGDFDLVCRPILYKLNYKRKK